MTVEETPDDLARAELHDTVMELVEVACSTLFVPNGDIIGRALQVKDVAYVVLAKAVLAERASGASWEQVAEALDQPVRFVVEHFAPMEASDADVQVLLGPWEWQEDEK